MFNNNYAFNHRLLLLKFFGKIGSKYRRTGTDNCTVNHNLQLIFPQLFAIW